MNCVPQDKDRSSADGHSNPPPKWVEPAAEVTTNVVTWVSVALGGGGAAAIVRPAVKASTIAIYSKAASRFSSVSQRGGEQVLEFAAETGVSIEELEARISSSDKRAMFAGIALDAGTRTVDQDKIRALGRALAAGVSDDALVDPAMLIVLAVADLEPPHVKLLRQLAEDEPPRVYAGGRVRFVTPGGPFKPRDWERRSMIAASPELKPVLAPVLATLTRHALVLEVDQTGRALAKYSRDLEQQGPATWENVGRPLPQIEVPNAAWRVTDFGLDVVALLRSSFREA